MYLPLRMWLSSANFYPLVVKSSVEPEGRLWNTEVTGYPFSRKDQAAFQRVQLLLEVQHLRYSAIQLVNQSQFVASTYP